MDFTLSQYTLLLNSLINAAYKFQTFEEYINSKHLTPVKDEKTLILRHDVDLLPQNSLQFAQIQASLGIKASYYFRIVPESFNEKIILEIAALGHEIGYHYETMDTAFVHRSFSEGGQYSKPETFKNELIDSAYQEFCKNLETFRKLVPVKTICMHGSPRSLYDNKEIWSKYKYKEIGLIGEPYYDMDFSKFAYYTDTARMWDGAKYSVRDKIESGTNQELFPIFHKTNEIISALNEDRFPKYAMFTFHPQRWTNKPFPWLKELIMQNIKNTIKAQIVKKQVSKQNK